MSKRERPYPFISADVLIPDTSSASLRQIGARLLPPSVKQHIKAVLFSLERHRELYDVTAAGVSARFHLQTKQDAWRLKTGFEGQFSQQLIQTCAQLGQKHGVVWDIGAAQGFYTVLSAKAGNRVVAVEPDPQSRSYLRDNLGLNHAAQQVTLLPYALGDQEGSIVLYSDGANGSAPSIQRTAGQRGEISVPLRTMDALVSRDRIPTPDLVKIDVEGAEAGVLRGGGTLFTAEDRPADMFLEIHPGFLENHFASDAETVWHTVTRDFGYRPSFALSRGQELLCHFHDPAQ